MNKLLTILTLSTLLSANIFAAHSACFRPYSVSVANKSGGMAEVKKTEGIRGVAKKSEIPNNSSVRIIIQKRGAQIEIKAGPEGNKSEREVKFYSKDPRNFRPMVVLNPKGLSTEGFSTKLVNFSVKIENQSDGTARIIDTCDASGKGSTIGEGKSTSISVRPSGYIIVEAGPENQKMRYKIIFADQRGDNPSIILGKRGFFTSGVQGKSLDIQVKRVPIMHPVKQKMEQKMKEMKPKRVNMKKRSSRYDMKTEKIKNVKNIHVRRAS